MPQDDPAPEPAAPDPNSPAQPPADAEALRAWYAANYEPVGKPAKQLEQEKPAAASDTPPPGQNQELPAVTPDLLKELRARKEAPATPRTARPASASQRPAAGSADASAASQSRREQAEQLRQKESLKASRFRLWVFLAMVVGTILASIAIWWLIQTKFGGKIPYV